MARMEVKEPDKIKITFWTTMTLDEWKTLREQFKKNQSGYVEWPASDLANDITDMVNQIEKEFYPNKT